MHSPKNKVLKISIYNKRTKVGTPVPFTFISDRCQPLILFAIVFITQPIHASLLLNQGFFCFFTSLFFLTLISSPPNFCHFKIFVLSFILNLL
ncbi:hypothetical protein Hanom_Chr12g01165431 [Helianthus anomalus]